VRWNSIGRAVLGALGTAFLPSYAITSPANDCPIAVDFISECCGPDPYAEEAIQDLLLSKRFKHVRVDVYAWGIEGESTFCIDPGRRKDDLVVELRRILIEAKRSPSRSPPNIRLNEKAWGTFKGPWKPMARPR
jgi:hypothetical protein